jgi:hypothetical protein
MLGWAYNIILKKNWNSSYLIYFWCKIQWGYNNKIFLTLGVIFDLSNEWNLKYPCPNFFIIYPYSDVKVFILELYRRPKDSICLEIG